MNNLLTLTCSKQKHTFSIINDLKVDLQIINNPYGLKPQDLFLMAARVNKKRSFLFVSKLLGKHLPVNPRHALLMGALLAERYLEEVQNAPSGDKDRLLSAFKTKRDDYVQKPFVQDCIAPVIIGFAETATALGHAFYSSFSKADYFHTTRELLKDSHSIIDFEEEHSHATSHRCYVNEEWINNNREIILVDDEVTTGKTALNIIQSIHSKYPRSTYTIVSILDWRSEEDTKAFIMLERKLGITIHCVSLMRGTIEVSKAVLPKPEEKLPYPNSYQEISYHFMNRYKKEGLAKIAAASISLNGETREVPYLAETGRFGLSSSDNHIVDHWVDQLSQRLKKTRRGKKTLCVGTGEFMYIPMRIAASLGQGVFFQSTTRSPIFIQNNQSYGARYGLNFPNPEDPQIQHFLYNIPPKEYDELFIFFERSVPVKQLEPMLNELKKTGIPQIKVIFFSEGAGGENDGGNH